MWAIANPLAPGLPLHRLQAYSHQAPDRSPHEKTTAHLFMCQYVFCVVVAFVILSEKSCSWGSGSELAGKAAVETMIEEVDNTSLFCDIFV
jgi:hypothetical protein